MKKFFVLCLTSIIALHPVISIGVEVNPFLERERMEIREVATSPSEITKKETVKEERPTYASGEILVKWKDKVTEPSIRLMHSRKRTAVIETFYATHERERKVEVVRIREGQSVAEAVKEFRNNPLVEHAQPNYLFFLQTTPSFPNDLDFGKLWGLHNTGQTVGGIVGTTDADIDAPEAWAIPVTGSSAVIIAVTDTGVDYLHPDLNDNMWLNPGEIPGNLIDDDLNGFIDDIHGWDFFYHDNNPMDGDGHGTHVAGTIAAEGNNAIGVAGVMWDAQIMALQIFDTTGWFAATLSDIISAINYSVTEGAHIINASWGGGPGVDAPGDFLRDAIEAAGEKGVLFVAAAGNRGDDNAIHPMFPASYTLPNIISVAATNNRDELALFSNFGSTSVHVAAPGVDIWSAMPGNLYGYMSGTSMAAHLM